MIEINESYNGMVSAMYGRLLLVYLFLSLPEENQK